jgi:hypothetical protein
LVWCGWPVARPSSSAIDCGADTAKGQVQVGEQHLPEEEKEQDSQRYVQTLGGASMIEVLKQAAEDVSKAYDILAFAHTERALELLAKTRTSLRQAIREHAMYEVQRLGQEIEQEPVGFAGIEMWIGNTRIKKLMTQTELHSAIDPWAIVKFNSDGCIDALKEKNT